MGKRVRKENAVRKQKRKDKSRSKLEKRKKKQDCQRGTLCPEERSRTADTFLSGSAVRLSQRLQITITRLLAPTGKLISQLGLYL